MKILITGGAGFIGSHTVKELISRGHDVVVFDDLSIGKREYIPKEVEFIKGDITKYKDLQMVPKDIEGVIHLAAKISVAESFDKPELYEKVNVIGTINLLKLIPKTNVKNLVFSSSAAVYGSPKRIPIKENFKLSPQSPYAITKVCDERYIQLYSNVYGFNATTLRYFNVYGPGQDPNSPYSGVITIFEERAKKNYPLIIYGDGNQTRDFIHVKEVAKINAIMIENGVHGTFNVGTGKETSINELARRIIKKYKSKSKIMYKPARKGDVKGLWQILVN